MSPESILRSALPEKRRLRWSIALAVLTNVSAVALLATSMWLIVSAAAQPPILWLSFAVVGVRAFALGRAFFRYVERLVSHDGVFKQLPKLRARLYDRLAELAPWGVTGFGRGDTLTRFVRDIDELQFYPLRVIVPSVAAFTVTVASCLAMGVIAPVPAFAMTAIVSVGALLAVWVNRRSAQRSASLIPPARGAVADAVFDAVENWDVLVAFDASAQAQNRVRAAGVQLSTQERELARDSGLAAAILTVSGGLAIAIAALALSPLLSAGALTVPTAAVLLLLPIALIDVLAALPLAVHARASAVAAARRIAELLPDDSPAGIPDERLERERQVATVASTELRFRGVSAHYPDAARPALVDVSLDIEPGELIVLTGTSGAGKSTLAQVLSRMLDYAGSATLGGVELRELGAHAVRTHVVVCEQSPWMFHTTVRGNLTFARPGATDAELHDVLSRVGLTDWIAERDGLETNVGERGEFISGGQAQRLALARALLSDAPIIVCDEPTAHLNPSLADHLLRDIAALSPERTVIILSHRELPDGLPARTLQMVDGHLR